jgi:uncharacterized protein (DUF58 family)
MSSQPHQDWPASLSVREIRRLGKALPKRLKFTRDGKFVVFVTFGLGFAAVNSGNNLLYLIFGMMLSLIMVSGVLSELNLRSLRVKRIEATPLFVGQPMLVRVEVRNDKKRFRSLSVEVTELISDTTQKAANKQTRGLVLLLEPGETKSCYIRLESSRRGVMPSAGLMIATKFPFGFFSKRRFFPMPERYVVLPALESLGGNRWETSVAGLDERMAGIGDGDEFHGLRDIRPGEDARMVAWKPSAKRDRLMVRENEKPATRRIVITLVNAVADPVKEFREFESAIRRAASLAHHYLGEGFAVGLATADGGFHPSSERRELKRLYLHLARLPLRRLKPGSTPKLFQSYEAVERVAIVTQGQKDAGLSVAAHREVLISEDPEVTAA